MSENSGVQFMGARTKRTHREMATDNDGSGDAAWEQHFHPRRSDSRPESTRLPPRRHRDGFDYRRPVMLSPRDNVVIDLTDDPDSPPQRNMTSFPGPLHTPHPHRPRLRFPRDLMNQTPPVANHPTVIDLEAETTGDSVDVSPNNGDVQIVGSSSVRPRPIEPRYLDNNGIPMHFRPHIQPSRISEHGRSRRGEPAPARSFFPTEEDLLAFVSDTLGFDYNPPSQPPPRPRRSSYKGLDPAPEGFTRLLAEDDVPVCPNCQDELGTGEGLKQQIHIAKPCGHVYCGECAGNRSISKSKKATSKTRPFSKCQVAGCNKPVSSPTAMYHLYL
ncbi:Zinc finger, RING-type, conserved site [Penicillium camemberti]|uniref:Zinc finger, RING-type, conserved site n=1 Tax=Penicillium camemberti (strain FM 013) TaxID=1429867 RepID=A0A0G4PII9_PENC3|nr:Zinc finger, RING-type, conserved site [Penicillium camemberti]